MESLEAGSRVFLLDEDTSAANFMVRDDFMQRVIAPEKEPITPYLERVRDLYEKAGVSTILVAGSSGAFFHEADLVIQMDTYQPKDITGRVKELLPEYPIRRAGLDDFAVRFNSRVMTRPPQEKPRRNYYGDAVDRPEKLKTKVHGKEGFSLGRQDVDLSALEQLCDSEQTAALAFLLRDTVEKKVDGKKTLTEIAEEIFTALQKSGPAVFKENGYVSGGFALPRRQELYGCLNRYRRP